MNPALVRHCPPHMRILVVDDEPAVAGVIAEGLQSLGNEIVVAGGGEEALQLVESERLDLMFLDVVMPDVDGLEVLRRVRLQRPRLPVIVMSGWVDHPAVEAARLLGVAAVVPKPITLKHLASALSGTRSDAG